MLGIVLNEQDLFGRGVRKCGWRFPGSRACPLGSRIGSLIFILVMIGGSPKMKNGMVMYVHRMLPQHQSERAELRSSDNKHPLLINIQTSAEWLLPLSW